MYTNIPQLKQAAKHSLSQAKTSPRKLILVHSGLIVLLSLLIYALDWLLEHQISQSGGLGGISSRSVLSTVQVLLRLTQTVLLPFWQMGYLFVSLKLSREQPLSPWDLAEGFRRFGPVLRLNLLRSVIFSILAVASSYAASTIFFISPLSLPMMEQLLSNEQILQDPEAMMAVIEQTATPLLLLFAGVYLIVLLPFYYRYRLDSFILLDNPDKGALYALRTSRKAMKGYCKFLLRMDLSWWWFYLLDGLTVVLCYADVILTILGISLPVSAQLLSFLCLSLSLLSQLGLYYWKRNEVAVSYAHAYAFITAPEETL